MKNTKNSRGGAVRRYLVPALFALLILLADQLSKNWAVAALYGRDSVPLIEGVFQLTYATNTGAAWSILSGQRTLLLGVTALALFAIGYAATADILPYKISRWALYAILGGALGNFADRLARPGGAVVDMFDFCLINFPIFNIADIFISVGGCVFIVCLLLEYTKRSRELKKEPLETYSFTISELEPFSLEELDDKPREDERHDR